MASAHEGTKTILRGMPEDVRNNVALSRSVKRIHDQFRQLVPQPLLDQVNSLYLFKERDRSCSQQASRCGDDRTIWVSSPDDEATEVVDSTRAADEYKLVVYVENSVAKAEFNARRELIKLKYLECFGININTFEIKTSLARYRNQHPFRVGKTGDGASSDSSQSLMADYSALLKRQLDEDSRLESHGLDSDVSRETSYSRDPFGLAISKMQDGPLKESFKSVQSAREKKQ